MPNEEPGTCLPFQCQTQVRKTNIQSVIPSTCLWDLAKPASATDYREFNFSPSVCNSVMVLDQSEWARSSGITKAPQASVAYDSFRGAVRGQEGVFIHTCHSRPRWMAATSMPLGQRTSEGFFLTGTKMFIPGVTHTISACNSLGRISQCSHSTTGRMLPHAQKMGYRCAQQQA